MLANTFITIGLKFWVKFVCLMMFRLGLILLINTLTESPSMTAEGIKFVDIGYTD